VRKDAGIIAAMSWSSQFSACNIRPPSWSRSPPKVWASSSIVRHASSVHSLEKTKSVRNKPVTLRDGEDRCQHGQHNGQADQPTSEPFEPKRGRHEMVEQAGYCGIPVGLLVCSIMSSRRHARRCRRGGSGSTLRCPVPFAGARGRGRAGRPPPHRPGGRPGVVPRRDRLPSRRSSPNASARVSA